MDSDRSDDELTVLENEKDRETHVSVDVNKVENKLRPKKKSKNVAQVDEYEIDSSDEEVRHAWVRTAVLKAMLY